MKGSRPLTRENVKAVLKATDSIRHKTLLTLGFCTGYRISELLSLKISDVSTDGTIHSHVTVKAAHTKTKTTRSVMLNSDAKKALTVLINWLQSKGFTDATTPLFLSQKRTTNGDLKAISRIQAHRIFKDLFEQIGLLGHSYSTHSMRKTMAAYIYDMTGGKIEKVAAVLGHKSLNSTLSYLSFNNSDIDNALTALEF